MNLQDVLKTAKKKFENEIDTSDWFQKVTHTLKTPYNNNFVTIRELKDVDYFEITFFKSDRKLNDLFDDYSEVGITFYPKFIDDVVLLFNSVDA
jgi:hypothetical protein